MLLKQQTASKGYAGFQNTQLGKGLNFRAVERGRPFVQIVHVNSNHWLTTTNVDCALGEVRIFDSAYSYVTLNTQKQIYSFLRPEEDVVTFKTVNSQMQNDLSSCGLFAIAAAAELSAGSNPPVCQWDITTMRDHLMHCLEAQQMITFPTSGERRISQGTLFNERIHCTCRMPNNPRRGMVQCDKCTKWYHIDCCMTCGIDDALAKDQQWTTVQTSSGSSR